MIDDTDSFERTLRLKRRMLGLVEIFIALGSAAALYFWVQHVQRPEAQPLVDPRIVYGVGGVAIVGFLFAGLKALFTSESES